MGFVFAQIDPSELRGVLGTVSFGSFVVAVACMFGALGCSVVRWHRIVRVFGERLSMVECGRLYAVSNLFNQMLPPPIGGDAYRVIAARQRGMALSPAVESIFLDRVFGLATQLVLILVLLPWVDLGQTDTEGAVWVLSAVMLLGASFVLTLPWSVRRFSHLLPRMLLRAYVRGKRLFTRPPDLSIVVVFSLAAQLLFALSLWWVTPDMAPLNVLSVVLLAGVIVLVTAVPISIGGWGLREGGVVAGLSMLGADESAAIAAALLWAFVHVCLALVGAALLLFQGRAARTGSPTPQED